MSIKVGMPVMYLNKGKGQTGKRTGCARAVLCEALEERYSSDDDLNKDLTKDNIYLTAVKSGHALADIWEKKADSFEQIQKNGKKRKLRADAHIGFAGICKPAVNSEFNNYDPEEQIRFLTDSFKIIKDLYEERGMIIDYGVIHFDEGNPHLHYGGRDEEYKLTKKINLKLFNDLNKSEYVTRMHELGWDIEPLEGYDTAKAEQMTAEELEDYKAYCIERKRSRKSGRSSKEFKADKEAEKIVWNAEQEAEAYKLEQMLKFNQDLGSYRKSKFAEIDEESENYKSEELTRINASLENYKSEELTRINASLENYKSEELTRINENLENYKSKKLNNINASLENYKSEELTRINESADKLKNENEKLNERLRWQVSKLEEIRGFINNTPGLRQAIERMYYGDQQPQQQQSQQPYRGRGKPNKKLQWRPQQQQQPQQNGNGYKCEIYHNPLFDDLEDLGS